MGTVVESNLIGQNHLVNKGNPLYNWVLLAIHSFSLTIFMLYIPSILAVKYSNYSLSIHWGVDSFQRRLTEHHRVDRRSCAGNHSLITCISVSFSVPGDHPHQVLPAAMKLAFRYHLQTMCQTIHCVDSLVLYMNSPTKTDGTSLLWDVNGNGLVSCLVVTAKPIKAKREHTVLNISKLKN